MKKRALLGVDFQHAFMSYGEIPVPNGELAIPPFNNFVREIIRGSEKDSWVYILSRDWHPVGSIHFRDWPEHAIQNTSSAEFHPALITQGAYVIFKGTRKDQRYAFSAFEETELEELLKNNKVEEVFIGGLAREYCVKYTALDSVKSGFKTFLLQDATRAVDPRSKNMYWASIEMIRAGVHILTVDQAIKYIHR